MSINSIDHDEMTRNFDKWDNKDDVTPKSGEEVKCAAARRRIEALKEIRESGLSMEEARELGLLDP